MLSAAAPRAGAPMSATCRFGDTASTNVLADADMAPAQLQVGGSGAAGRSGASANGAAGRSAGGGGGANGAVANGAAGGSAAESAAAKLAAEALKQAQQEPASAAEAEQLQVSCHHVLLQRMNICS